jgi:ADP-ribose pyrophosphatase YjhB (NUDIX family)
MSYKLLVEGWRKFLKESDEPNPVALDQQYDSAHVVIKNKMGQVLLLKRAEVDEWMPGKWSLPGGGKREEESLIQGAVREIKEETGLEVIPEDLHFLEDISRKQNHAFFLATKALGTVKLDSENSEFVWTDVSKLIPKDCVPDLIQVLSSVGSMNEKKETKIPKDFEKQPFTNKLKGGAADNSKPEDFDPKALRKGIKHELEHTNDKQEAAEISADHEKEWQDLSKKYNLKFKYYYDAITAMEKNAIESKKDDK